MKKIIYLFLAIASLLVPQITHAVCPVCTIAVGTGIGLSRWLGIDDTITGVWIGGFLVSLSIWTYTWLKNKKIKIPYDLAGVFILSILLTILPLFYTDILGHPLNKILFFGYQVDKLILGMITGATSFWLFAKWYESLKAKRGKAMFHFQKVIMPIIPLIFFTIIFYFLTK